MTGNFIMAVSEHCRTHVNGFSHRALDGEAARINLRCDIFNYDALSSV